MTINERNLLAWIDPVVTAKEAFLIQRPLMYRMDRLGGPNRTLDMMLGEQAELNNELVLLRQIPQESWNGNRTKTAEEAADVLVHGAAGLVVYGWHAMNLSQKTRFMAHLRRIYAVEQEIGLPIPEVAVAVIKNKNSIFNYREFAFRKLPREESDTEANLRYTQSVRGLKILRRRNPLGILTNAILEAAGYREEVQGQDPFKAHLFLRGIAHGALTHS